jgi:hypothetical protein
VKKLTPRNFGLCVTAATPVKAGTLLRTPFTLSDGSSITLLARQKNGGIELTDWGMTADYLTRFNRRWEDVLDRMALRHTAHGRVTIQGREIVSRIEGRDASRNVGAIVQTILTLNSVILLAHDPEDEAFVKKVDKVVRKELGKTHEIIPDWYDAGHDPHKAFAVDYRVNGATPPVHLFVVSSASKITRVTASSLFYKSIDLDVPSIVIVNQEISTGPRQKERIQVAADRIVWNIDRQGSKLPEYVQKPKQFN